MMNQRRGLDTKQRIVTPDDPTVGSNSESDARPNGVQLKRGAKFINRDRVDHLTCRLPHYIYITIVSFVTCIFSELIKSQLLQKFLIRL